MQDLIELINAELPQYQCGRCDTPGCKPYAKAIAEGSPHNRCVPGGEETLLKIQAITNREILQLDEKYGPALEPQIVNIIEEDCIGCKKCIDACPVDAIVGAANLMHAVISDLCTGCELCIEPCPVDCIELLSIEGDQSKAIRQTSEKFFNLKVSLEDELAGKTKLNKNIKLNLELGNLVNAKIDQRNINKNDALKHLQTEILESQKLEKLLDSSELDGLIGKLNQ